MAAGLVYCPSNPSVRPFAPKTMGHRPNPHYEIHHSFFEFLFITATQGWDRRSHGRDGDFGQYGRRQVRKWIRRHLFFLLSFFFVFWRAIAFQSREQHRILLGRKWLLSYRWWCQPFDAHCREFSWSDLWTKRAMPISKWSSTFLFLFSPVLEGCCFHFNLCLVMFDCSKNAARAKQLSLGRKKFNMDPKKGIEFLLQQGLLQNTPQDIAAFLYR